MLSQYYRKDNLSALKRNIDLGRKHGKRRLVFYLYPI